MGIEKMIVQLALAFCVGFSLAQEVPEKKDAIGLNGKDGAGSTDSERNKRLFFVSTASSTSTLITDFTCYISTATLLTCKKRRKRSYLEDSIGESSLEEQAINPARIQPQDEIDTVEAGFNEADAKQREGKFLLYWLTTTSVLTTTTYTETRTLASIACTPSSYAMSNCASLG